MGYGNQSEGHQESLYGFYDQFYNGSGIITSATVGATIRLSGIHWSIMWLHGIHTVYLLDTTITIRVTGYYKGLRV